MTQINCKNNFDLVLRTIDVRNINNLRSFIQKIFLLSCLTIETNFTCEVICESKEYFKKLHYPCPFVLFQQQSQSPLSFYVAIIITFIYWCPVFINDNLLSQKIKDYIFYFDWNQFLNLLLSTFTSHHQRNEISPIIELLLKKKLH